MPPKTLIGFDFGTRCIGIAVGQSLTQTAKPLTSISAVKGEPEWPQVRKIIDEWKPDALVVGIPLNMDGTHQPITFKALHFAEKLRQQFGLPVYTVDERLTTVEAKAQIFAAKGYKGLTKAAIDSFSAKLILEEWLHNPTTKDVTDESETSP